MADNDTSGEKKHVDEDWKERARREKESLESGRAAAAEKGHVSGPGPAPGPEAERAAGRGAFPPATFLGLIAGMAAQASVFLGFEADPVTGKAEIDVDAARHVIDTLAMLREKTRGNLDENESAALEDLLYTLRMEYVRRTGSA